MQEYLFSVQTWDWTTVLTKNLPELSTESFLSKDLVLLSSVLMVQLLLVLMT